MLEVANSENIYLVGVILGLPKLELTGSRVRLTPAPPGISSTSGSNSGSLSVTSTGTPNAVKLTAGRGLSRLHSRIDAMLEPQSLIIEAWMRWF